MTRRALSLAVAVVFLFLAVSTAPAADPIRIGFLGPMTGIFAQAGKDMLDGLKMGLEQASGGQAAGRKIELIEEDTEGNPATAMAKYRKLVQQDKIHVLTGVLLATSATPWSADRARRAALAVPHHAGRPHQAQAAKWILRSNFAASQPMHPLGDYAAKILKYKRVAILAMDNPFGHERLGGFQRVFEDAGGRVVQKTWVPLNAMDFAPYLGQVPRDVDAVVQVFVAGQAVRFAKQYGESGLKGKPPLIGTGVYIDEIRAALDGRRGGRHDGRAALGAHADEPGQPDVHEAGRGASSSARRPTSTRSCTAPAAGSPRRPRPWTARWRTARSFLAAIRRASETIEDPRGPIKLDEYGNPTENVYILKVEKVGGRLQNTVIHTYPMVSQFWTYKPEEFLKAPAYDRNYPPVKP